RVTSQRSVRLPSPTSKRAVPTTFPSIGSWPRFASASKKVVVGSEPISRCRRYGRRGRRSSSRAGDASAPDQVGRGGGLRRTALVAAEPGGQVEDQEARERLCVRLVLGAQVVEVPPRR